ncbi:rod shape-determining protein MreD [Halorhodospira neutriphila]|uniref:Rod shape-determining protein MreD n=1 Tax=Halorhodospira neutriphila TaxID=168379 RepID=A0ABS1E353_9GAMM|nr:rod shape-determining protein MreD [Halorhodospira neutriphila]
MNEQAPPSGGGIILASVLAALTLSIVPLPTAAEPLRPEWAALILLYWSLALPTRVGVSVGWLIGLTQDFLHGTLLGQHALAFALIAFLILRFHQQIRPVPAWQQALAVLALLLTAQLVVFWVNGVIGRPAPPWQAWAASFIGAALWPLIFYSMRGLRRRFQVQ